MEQLVMPLSSRDLDRIASKSKDVTDGLLYAGDHVREDSLGRSCNITAQKFPGDQDEGFDSIRSLDGGYLHSSAGVEVRKHLPGCGSWVYDKTKLRTGTISVQLDAAPTPVQMAKLKAIPKIELHAHLNGCVRSSTLRELYLERGCKGKVSNSDLDCLILKENRSLTECFRLFPFIHALTTDHAIVTRITKEAIEDFILDNVVYLELRTTPKTSEANGMSKRSYIEAVLAGFDDAGVSYDTKQDGGSRHSMQVRLLLSIDRRESTAAAMETVELAWELRHRGVVGIDLSGDPAVGTWNTFLPALMRAKQLGLPLTLHCGEVPRPEEIRAMIALKPSRLGHVCCLEEKEWRLLLESQIPVEVCLTSNVRTEVIPSVNDHHFRLKDMELLLLAKSAVDYTFADDVTKRILHRIFDDALQ
ncbi:hypothetical protein R1sor_010803 [Riccia sorocarpa]|uniref:Adenosine deaminase domain-containing protein n=1 Tax=Riccia sorocarpa TaxID=122646 RepID=A0ABD3I1U3_9MARC